MNTEYIYTMAESFRREGRALYGKADAVLHDHNLSVTCREALAANYKTQASLAYDQADEMDREARRVWRGEAA